MSHGRGRKPPKDLVVVDAEYKVSPYKFLCISGWRKRGADEEGFTFWTFDEFMDWVLEQPPAVIYAHNASRAEFLVLVDWLMYRRRRMLRRGVLINGRLVEFHLGGHTWRDSVRLFPATIEELGKRLAPTIEKAPLDYERIDEEPRARLREASLNHALILLRSLETLAGQVGETPVSLPLTCGSLGMRDLQTRFAWRVWPQVPQEVVAAGRAALFGGRCELFERGPRERLNVYDINSSYPFQLAGRVPWDNPRAAKRWQDAHLADVTVCGGDLHIPVLPYKFDGTMFFSHFNVPVRGWYCRNELQQAVAHGYKVLQFHGGWTFEEHDFSPWVHEHYEYRKSGAFRGLMSKILLNAVVGKFQEHATASMLHDVWAIDDQVFFAISRKEIKHRNLYHAAAWVLAAARVQLHKYLVEGEGIACDTDSIITRQRTLDKYCGAELGQLKLEMQGEDGELIAPKVYRLGARKKMKGVPHGSATFDTIFGERRGIYSRTCTVRELLEMRCKGGTMEVERPFRLCLERTKRLYSPDGSSRAYTVEEIRSGEFQMSNERRLFLYQEREAAKGALREKAVRVLRLCGVPGGDFLGQVFDVVVGPRGGLKGFSPCDGWKVEELDRRGKMKISGKAALKGIEGPYGDLLFDRKKRRYQVGRGLYYQ